MSLTSMAACPSAPVSSCGRIEPGDEVCFANIRWFSWRCCWLSQGRRSWIYCVAPEKGHGSRYRGYLHFRDADKKPQFAIVSVKGGENINSAMVRDLKGTMEREKAALGLFLTLNEPTREMEREAASAGLYETGGMKVPKLQILTAAQILDNRRPQVPFGFTEGFKKRGAKKRAKISCFDDLTVMQRLRPDTSACR